MRLVILIALIFISLRTSANVTLFDSQVSSKPKWSVLNDTVMGGKSSSRWNNDPSPSFEGILSLANNGGFASVRNTINDLDLSETDGIHIRVKGDGRNYQFRIRSKTFSWADYMYDFQTINGLQQTFFLPFKDFKSSWRGFSLGFLPSLRGKDITEIGFFLGDKKPGNFKLNIYEISAINEIEYSKILYKESLTNPDNLPKLIQKFGYNSSKPISITFKTDPYTTYAIEASNDLKNWSKINNVQGNGENFEFIDSREIISNQQFYRLKVLE